MIIVLSQKPSSDSSYSGDEVFRVYHYPARYKNQIHVGDTFVYCQGSRDDKSQRCYFGTGEIGKIEQADEGNFYAELINTSKFEKKVPIYLPNGGYVEQLGYESVRRSINPPWQWSIRPLSEAAYSYIIANSGGREMKDTYNLQLKKAIQKYYIANEPSAILEVIEIAEKIAAFFNLNGRK